MRPAEGIEKLIREIHDTSSAEMDERVIGDVLSALEESEKPSAQSQPKIRRMIMKYPITKLAAAVVVVALVVLGLSELIETPGGRSGVVWAEVARKVQASRGHIVRCRENLSVIPFDSDYSMKYNCPTHSRTDYYEAQKITHTFYTDLTDPNTKILTAVYHTHKRYMSRTFERNEHKFLLEQHDDWMNPRYLVQTILACEHTELGQKTIDGVLCEGIETTDPAVMGPLPGPVDLLEVHLQLWVDAKTKYPVLFNSDISIEVEGEAASSEGVMDQFQWDVELDPGIFEPNIPPDYVDMRSL
ncbi:MAG: hypothetical protein ACYTBS_11430 [Planctomycetota bacterium]|jgi:hypothetical protein